MTESSPGNVFLNRKGWREWLHDAHVAGLESGADVEVGLYHGKCDFSNLDECPPLEVPSHGDAAETFTAECGGCKEMLEVGVFTNKYGEVFLDPDYDRTIHVYSRLGIIGSEIGARVYKDVYANFAKGAIVFEEPEIDASATLEALLSEQLQMHLQVGEQAETIFLLVNGALRSLMPELPEGMDASNALLASRCVEGDDLEAFIEIRHDGALVRLLFKAPK